MHRSLRLALFIPSAAATCWYGMMLIHETGHMLGALATGGTVQHLEFPLAGFSRTDVSPNPHPGIVVWSGPLFGAILPFAAWLTMRVCRKNSYLLHLFAAFCLIANGAYIGAGSFDRIGDAGDMLRTGSPIISLWLFGALAAGASLLMLHRLGPRLGSARLTASDMVIAWCTAAGLLAFAALV